MARIRICAAVLPKAAVEGTQSEGCCHGGKAFLCAGRDNRGGVNASAARIGERELREIHLPAAEACAARLVLKVLWQRTMKSMVFTVI
ncbi:MAG: hypothetical protein ACLTRS_05680 [Lachnospiraceae bacterium]